MRRLGPPLAGMGGVIGFIALASGGGGAIGGLGGIVLIGGIIWFALSWVNQRRPAVPDDWRHSDAFAYRPTAGHEPSSPTKVARALARIETKELASSASFGVGIGLLLLIIVLLGLVWGSDFADEPLAIPEMFPIYVHPLAGMVIVASHRARTRSTRDGTQELFDSCPVEESTRTSGHLLTAWLPGLIGFVFPLVFAALILSKLTVVHGAIGARQVALPFGAAVLCFGAAALGTALARWAPWTPIPIAAVVLVGVASINLATAGDRTTEPIRQLSTWLTEPEVDLRFTAPHWAAHHLWILALVGIVTVVALARDVRRIWVPISLAAFALLATVSAIAATRPIDPADAERIAALINHPDDHQRCVETGEVRVCAYKSSDAVAQHLAKVVDPVTEAVPPGALAGWTIRQGFDIAIEQLDPEVRNRLAPSSADQRVIPLVMSGHSEADQGALLWAALTAVGATEQRSDALVLSLEGEARGVIALWLAARGVDERTALAMTTFNSGADTTGANYYRPWPDSCYAGPTPVIWAATDLDSARLLIAAPDDRIHELLQSDWSHWTNRRTSTAELLEAAGLDPVANRPGRTRTAEC